MNSRASLLEKYADLLKDIDVKAEGVFRGAPDLPCKNKCFDCCRQLFPVSFAEAFHISEGMKTLDRTTRRARQRTAEKIREKVAAHNPLQFEKKGVDKMTAYKTHRDFAEFLHSIESDCPALDPQRENGACTVYEFRNHDCRTMGLSFDKSENAIVGCFRFASLKHLIPGLMDFNYRYGEKMALDRALIKAVTGGIFTENIIYFTTMCGPILKDYAGADWIAFFEKKGVPADTDNEKFWVVID